MKKLLTMAVALIIMTTTTLAEMNMPFTEWLEVFCASAEQAVTQDEPMVAEGAPLIPIPPFTPIGIGSRGDDVIKLQEKLIELGVLTGKADGIFGTGTEAAVIAVQKVLGWEGTGIIASADELHTVMSIEPGDGVNLAIGTSDEWSEWMTPEYNVKNSRFIVSSVFLGEKQVGDFYTCQVEVQFEDVYETQGIEDGHFRFIANGRVDDSWGELGESNIWDSIVVLEEAPDNATYKYTITKEINDINISANIFNIGFQCDYWAGGRFRVRRIKVEKGINATEWSPAEADVSNGINLATGTSDEWSEWMTPGYNESGRYFVVSTAYLGEKWVGDLYTCQVEIDFADVTASQDIEDAHFRFVATGRVDESWGELGESNIWKYLVDLSAPPANGVYKYVATKVINTINANATDFELGFLCENWASGRFRVRCVKVEKGAHATDWTPAS